MPRKSNRYLIDTGPTKAKQLWAFVGNKESFINFVGSELL